MYFVRSRTPMKIATDGCECCLPFAVLRNRGKDWEYATESGALPIGHTFSVGNFERSNRDLSLFAYNASYPDKHPVVHEPEKSRYAYYVQRKNSNKLHKIKRNRKMGRVKRGGEGRGLCKLGGYVTQHKRLATLQFLAL